MLMKINQLNQQFTVIKQKGFSRGDICLSLLLGEIREGSEKGIRKIAGTGGAGWKGFRAETSIREARKFNPLK